MTTDYELRLLASTLEEKDFFLLELGITVNKGMWEFKNENVINIYQNNDVRIIDKVAFRTVTMERLKEEWRLISKH